MAELAVRSLHDRKVVGLNPAGSNSDQLPSIIRIDGCIQPRSEPALELHSRAASSVGPTYCSSSPNMGSNSGGRQTLKKCDYPTKWKAVVRHSRVLFTTFPLHIFLNNWKLVIMWTNIKVKVVKLSTVKIAVFIYFQKLLKINMTMHSNFNIQMSLPWKTNCEVEWQKSFLKMNSGTGMGDLSPEQFICAYCHVQANQRCTGCHETFYCSREHQKLHWRKHKNQCCAFKVRPPCKWLTRPGCNLTTYIVGCQGFLQLEGLVRSFSG